jgi:KDO2-lipid IV(A) lauroyltransferase
LPQALLRGLSFPRLRRNAEINLKLAYPELDEGARQRILKGSFRNLGRLLGEISQFPRLNRENISSVVVYEGLNHFERHSRLVVVWFC